MGRDRGYYFNMEQRGDSKYCGVLFIPKPVQESSMQHWSLSLSSNHLLNIDHLLGP